jgi:hydroxymethylpyrimidine pyrophosphatase-like HAD family hydrolase
MKESSTKNVTAAIGDGGNDISMIQGDSWTFLSETEARF